MSKKKINFLYFLTKVFKNKTKSKEKQKFKTLKGKNLEEILTRHFKV